MLEDFNNWKIVMSYTLKALQTWLVVAFLGALPISGVLGFIVAWLISFQNQTPYSARNCLSGGIVFTLLAGPLAYLSAAHQIGKFCEHQFCKSASELEALVAWAKLKLWRSSLASLAFIYLMLLLQFAVRQSEGLGPLLALFAGASAFTASAFFLVNPFGKSKNSTGQRWVASFGNNGRSVVEDLYDELGHGHVVLLRKYEAEEQTRATAALISRMPPTIATPAPGGSASAKGSAMVSERPLLPCEDKPEQPFRRD